MTIAKTITNTYTITIANSMNYHILFLLIKSAIHATPKSFSTKGHVLPPFGLLVFTGHYLFTNLWLFIDALKLTLYFLTIQVRTQNLFQPRDIHVLLPFGLLVFTGHFLLTNLLLYRRLVVAPFGRGGRIGESWKAHCICTSPCKQILI